MNAMVEIVLLVIASLLKQLMFVPLVECVHVTDIQGMDAFPFYFLPLFC